MGAHLERLEYLQTTLAGLRQGWKKPRFLQKVFLGFKGFLGF